MMEAKFGSPFYILDLDRFHRNYNDFLQRFKKIYSNTQIAYSYKTNYIPQLCKVAKELGGWAEVVSEMEYELAVRVGVKPEEIIFNGPYKSPGGIENAVLADSVVNLDSFYEIDILQKIAAANEHKQVGVGIRVNFQYDRAAPLSRFGFNVENGSLSKVLGQIAGLNNVYVDGIHCHFMNPAKSAEGYRKIVKKMLELYDEHFVDKGLRFIDVGGGFFSPMPAELVKQFDNPPPSFQDYADAIATQFTEFFSHTDRKPLLVLEPGISLTADVMRFVARVIDMKSVGQKKLVLVNGSIYDIKPTLHKKNLPMEIVSSTNKDAGKEKIDIVGYTCMEGDCLAKDVEGAISPGDYVIFKNTGAYTVVLRPPFIRPAPPIVSLENDTYELIRRAGNFDDVFGSYGSP
jgi:diaminopimelate decarboxylase